MEVEGAFFATSIFGLVIPADVLQTVVPGFEFTDHDFLTEERLKQLVTPEQAGELAWLLRQDKS